MVRYSVILFMYLNQDTVSSFTVLLKSIKKCFSTLFHHFWDAEVHMHVQLKLSQILDCTEICGPILQLCLLFQPLLYRFVIIGFLSLVHF